MAENPANNAADDPAAIPGRILVGKGERYEYLLLPLGNRHGLVTGATGTGKTVTLQVMAEGFARAGVPSSPPTSRAISPASPKPARPSRLHAAARPEHRP